MRRGNLAIVALLCAAALATGCSTTRPTGLAFRPGAIDPTRVLPKVDEFALEVDTSLSMSEPRKPERKLDVARDLTAAMVATIPDLAYQGEVRTFGGGCCHLERPTALLYGLERYSAAAAANAVGRIGCAGGPTPLHRALEATGTDFARLTTRGELEGQVPASQLPRTDVKAAIIIVSDGLDMGKRQIAAASALKKAWGDRLCIWAVQVGDAAEGRDMLQRIVDAGACGSLVAASELTNQAKLETLVRDALLYPDSDGDGVPDHLDKCPNTPKGIKVDANGCPLDSDGDGVPDYLDKCPDTPKGVKVDANGCPLDSDGDGVPDYLDKCPDTPRGVKVDANGCPEAKPAESAWTSLGNVLFDFDRSKIRDDAKPVLDKVTESLQADPKLRLTIEGHTDSIGTDDYNLKLSVRRADAVKSYLVSKGIDAARLATVGFGESKPVVPNDNPANRQKNRRAEFKTQS